MAWNTDMVMMLRSTIGDDAEPYTYSSIKLVDLLITAAIKVIMSVDFDRVYRVDVSDRSITPDPVGVGDLDFQILVVLQAVVILAVGEYRKKIEYSVSIKDGPSSIQTTDMATKTRQWMNDALAAYNGAVLAYKMGNGLSGAGIVGPYGIGLTPRAARSG